MHWKSIFGEGNLGHDESKEAVDDGVEEDDEEAVEEGELVAFKGEMNIFNMVEN